MLGLHLVSPQHGVRWFDGLEQVAVMLVSCVRTAAAACNGFGEGSLQSWPYKAVLRSQPSQSELVYGAADGRWAQQRSSSRAQTTPRRPSSSTTRWPWMASPWASRSWTRHSQEGAWQHA